MKNKKYLKAKKALNKYKYTFWKVIGTILFFPIVIILSPIVSKFFTPYLFKYPRTGIDEDGQEVNTLNHYLKDIKDKKLKNWKLTSEEVKEFEITDDHGNISCLILNNNSNKWVVALHGFKRNKYMGARNAIQFYKQGYNVIAFDAYAHGKTYGKYSDLGVTNSKLLNSVINWVKSNHQVEEIGVIGVSMGAASAVYWAQQYYQVNKIDWLISDCSLTQPVEQIRFFLKKYFKFLPWWITSFKINWFFEKYSKTNLKDMNLQKNLNSFRDLPVLFIHGKEDSFIDYHNSVMMYYEKSKDLNNNKIVIFENTDHSASISNHQEEYIMITLDFVKEVINKK